MPAQLPAPLPAPLPTLLSAPVLAPVLAPVPAQFSAELLPTMPTMSLTPEAQYRSLEALYDSAQLHALDHCKTEVTCVLMVINVELCNQVQNEK